MPNSPPTRPQLSLLAALGFWELPLTLVECLFVLGPLLLFFPGSQQRPELLLGVGALILLWTLLAARWARPFSGGPLTGERYLLARRLPGRVLRLRLGLWGGLGVLGAFVLHRGGILTPLGGFTFFTICLVHSFAVTLLRWALHGRLLRAALAAAEGSPAWLELQQQTLLDRLVEVALVLGAAAGLLLALFVYLFVPVSIEQVLRMEAFFPWTAVGLGALWYLWAAPRLVDPLVRWFERGTAGEERSRELLRLACAAAHELPARLALAKLGFFGAAGLLLLLEAVTLFRFTLVQAVLVFCAILVVTMGTSIYEMIWSRSVVRPVVANLLAQPGAEQLPRRPSSLRKKMMLSFGGVMVFSVVLPLFWTYLQYGSLRQRYALAQAEREMALLLPRLQQRPEAAAETVKHLTADLSGSPRCPGSRYLFVPARGAVPEPVPPDAARTIRSHVSGSLALPGLGFGGAFQRLDFRRPAPGSLAILVPLATGSGEGRNLPALIFFFLVTLGISLGVMLRTSADLTRPLGVLERRAGEMAQGQLERPLLPTGELDEVGRLTAALEAMRGALQGKIETVEALNLGLEQKVRERTAALEGSNEELRQAIAALKEAQHRLITSEKMASVGQLVAGIAHEINNPLNAMINTVEPLDETVRELLAAGLAGPGREVTQGEVESMLRVIRSAAQRTQRIVQALRNYARQDGEVPGPMDLHADLEESLALLGHSLRGIEVVRDFRATGMLHAFRGQLNQALVNLIGNAAAALEGRTVGRITLRTVDQGEAVLVEVEDNGPGIPPEILPRIFDPFFTTKEVGKGTGLGLSITQGIVENHGGRLTVRSTAAGTTFSLELPRRVPPAG